MILLASAALAADVGGYLRVMTRPDFEGGDGRLGYWNLYGRLLNEGPYAALELRQSVLDPVPGSTQPWTDLHAKIEGGTVQNADSGGGSLAYLRLSQLYVQAGNVGLRDTTWRLGTLESNFGDLGLYDMRPAQVLFDTVGAQARYQTRALELTVGAGDAGFNLKSSEYNTVLSAGATARVNIAGKLELGVGGQGYYEPEVVGNRYAPHDTPGVSYEDYLRGEVVQAYLDENPGQLADFPSPAATDASSWKMVGYLGFGKLGPLRWNSLYASYAQLHPDNFTSETVDGETVDIYITSLTDERTALLVGDEMQWQLVPGRYDVVLAGLYGVHQDGDNDLAPSDHDRTYMSAVLRNQVYLSPVVHLLVEGSVAQEVSHNGNAYRNHVDSLFENSGGKADSEGLEYGDSDTRFTWQAKGGVVLNPLGPGIYTRPSLRLLYGLQYSTQNNAFGNSFVESLDEYNDFGNVERHYHSVLALETEAWF
ncbi:MAG: hypothetical protein FJ090_03235 [Deltaproteobacteria bacterium]|nr:hypothetical protein [Deltaproteobacteria bacterium]